MARIGSGSLGTAVPVGMGVGLVAGIPQVLAAQAMARLVGLPDEHADIGPRFVKRVGEMLGERPGHAERWAIAGLFHFVYAAFWGALYGAVQTWRPSQPHVGGPLLGALIYALAFSPWGAATQTETENQPDERSLRETLLHWTAALSFSLTTAYLFSRPYGPAPSHESAPNVVRRLES